MGDRTYVELTIPTECEALANTVINAYEEPEWNKDQDFMVGTFNEVNYGDLPFLSDLADLGIPYESQWDAGSEYGAGIEYGRFTPNGEYTTLTVYESTRNPDIDELLRLSSKPKELIQYTHKYAEENTPLPWDNQVEYGKIYRMKQLLTA